VATSGLHTTPITSKWKMKEGGPRIFLFNLATMMTLLEWTNERDDDPSLGQINQYLHFGNGRLNRWSVSTRHDAT